MTRAGTPWHDGGEPPFDQQVRHLLDVVYERYQYDFRDYAPASIHRRVRQALSDLRCESVAELEDAVRHDAGMLSRLLQYLTIQVSDLFRDPEFWLALRLQVVPLLRTWPSLKLWIPGVAGGEELYAMAILLSEEGLLDRTVIYATDMNREALKAAEAGVYPLARLAGFSRNYQRAGGTRSLSEYYTAAYDSARFSRTLTGQVVFADHDLVTDSVFSEVQLISCRNVLIYFTPALQNRVLQLFSDSLVNGGVLCLGTKETLQFSPRAVDYQPIDARYRIFRRVQR